MSLATQRFKRRAGPDERHLIQQRVEQQVDAEINRWNADFVNVRWVYLVIGQSLPAAALLQNLYKHALEAQDTGCSPWVYRTPVRWFLTTGLREESFLLAREELRKLGLIIERRRFDHDRQEIVVEMCVDRDIFDAMYDGAIEAVRRRYREDLSAPLPDHRDA